MFNSLLHGVEYPDEQVKALYANIEAENMLSRTDCDGFILTLLEDMTDYTKNNFSVEMADKHILTSKASKRSRMPTQASKLKFLWNDVMETRTLLHDLKEPNQVEVAAFTKATNKCRATRYVCVLG